MGSIRPLPDHDPEGRISLFTDGVGKHPNVDTPKIPNIIRANFEPRIISPLRKRHFNFLSQVSLSISPTNFGKGVRT